MKKKKKGGSVLIIFNLLSGCIRDLRCFLNPPHLVVSFSKPLDALTPDLVAIKSEAQRSVFTPLDHPWISGFAKLQAERKVQSLWSSWYLRKWQLAKGQRVFGRIPSITIVYFNYIYAARNIFDRRKWKKKFWQAKFETEQWINENNNIYYDRNDNIKGWEG